MKRAPRTLALVSSGSVPIYALAGWWIFWLGASYTDLNVFKPPSAGPLTQYLLLILSFLFGHWAIRIRRAPIADGLEVSAVPHSSVGSPLRAALLVAALFCATMLFGSLLLSGALTSDFAGYFARMRQEESGPESLTGIHLLDVLTKVLAFPASYTVILVCLALGARQLGGTLALSILNILAFAYLWQVNYPLIHLFWCLAFYLSIRVRLRRSFDARIGLAVLLLFSVLLASAVNRFGGDLLGAVQHYVVNYHLIGFSFYDQQFRDPGSILHVHSFGRSSLGFLDQVIEALSKLVGAGYNAASSENSTFNDQAVDIGLDEIRESNAFGTLLFSFYRDFHLLGVIAGGFAYGAATTYSLYLSRRSWTARALFLLLASSWAMGMMVSPIEQAYFWFTVLGICAARLLSRLERGAS